MSCPVCGSDLVGDGYTTVRHCENIDVIGDGYEPDAGPVFCEPTEMSPASALTGTSNQIVAWKSRRREKLMEAFCSEFGVHGHPADWQDFCESEFAKYQRGEIPASKYMRDRSQPGQPAQR